MAIYIKEYSRKKIYRNNNLHILDLIGRIASDAEDRDCKNLEDCDSVDDTAGKAVSFLNSGRDFYLLYDSHELCILVTDKIREHEMHVSFRVSSLINSME